MSLRVCSWKAAMSYNVMKQLIMLCVPVLLWPVPSAAPCQPVSQALRLETVKKQRDCCKIGNRKTGRPTRCDSTTNTDLPTLWLRLLRLWFVCWVLHKTIQNADTHPISCVPAFIFCCLERSVTYLCKALWRIRYTLCVYIMLQTLFCITL